MVCIIVLIEQGERKMTERAKNKTHQLIEHVERLFKLKYEYVTIETGVSKDYTVATVRALARRGYRIERRVLSGVYRIYPKPKVEKNYHFELTEGEIIAIRELARKYPRGNEFAEDYAAELSSLDRKMTDRLAAIFDENEAKK
jgi:hypothetical protein